MRTAKIFAIMLLVIVTIAAGAFIYYKSATSDKNAPVIEITADATSTFAEGDDPNILLQGIIATDDRDGDVTKKLIVQSVTPILASEKATVVYAVSDSSYNIATVERTVVYVAKDDDASLADENKSAPVISLKEEAIEIPINSVINPFDYIEQIDDDKDVGLIENVFYMTNLDVTKEGSYDLAFVVSDSDNNRSAYASMKINVVQPAE